MGKFPVDAPLERVLRVFAMLGFVIVRRGNHVSLARIEADGTRTTADHSQSSHHQGFHFTDGAFSDRHFAGRIPQGLGTGIAALSNTSEQGNDMQSHQTSPPRITGEYVTQLDGAKRPIYHERWMEESLTGSASNLACPRSSWPSSLEYPVKVSTDVSGMDLRG
jgi:hypothetical protein